MAGGAGLVVLLALVVLGSVVAVGAPVLFLTGVVSRLRSVGDERPLVPDRLDRVATVASVLGLVAVGGLATAVAGVGPAMGGKSALGLAVLATGAGCFLLGTVLVGNGAGAALLRRRFDADGWRVASGRPDSSDDPVTAHDGTVCLAGQYTLERTTTSRFRQLLGYLFLPLFFDPDIFTREDRWTAVASGTLGGPFTARGERGERARVDPTSATLLTAVEETEFGQYEDRPSGIGGLLAEDEDWTRADGDFVPDEGGEKLRYWIRRVGEDATVTVLQATDAEDGRTLVWDEEVERVRERLDRRAPSRWHWGLLALGGVWLALTSLAGVAGSLV